MKRIVTWSVVLLFLVLVTYISFPSLFYHFSTLSIHGDLFNQISIINYLNNTSLDQLYHMPILYPLSYTLAKTHPLFGVAVYYKIFNFFGLDEKQSTSLYIILSLILGALGCFLLARELTQNTPFSLFLSLLMILHPLRNIHFVWLNFLSLFYIPFIFLFFIKFFKTGKKYFALLAALFSLMQFLASVYYGIFLWGIMIPIFLLISFLLKLVNLKRLIQQCLFLIIAALVVLFIFFPFISQNQSIDKLFDGNLVSSVEIFAYSKVLSPYLSSRSGNSGGLFPGFVFSFFVLSTFGIHVPRKRVMVFIILSGFLVAMSVLAFNHLLTLEILFLTFLILITIMIFISWKYFDHWMKLSILCLAIYFLFLFKVDLFGISGDYTLYGLFHKIIPVGGLKFFNRVALAVLPFFIVVAAYGSSRLFKGWHEYSRKRKVFILLFLLLFLILENKRNYYTFFDFNKNIPDEDQREYEIYNHIPFKQNKIILEIPFYFAIMQRNSYYTIHWKHHQNVLLNGKVSARPDQYLEKLKGIIGSYQRNILFLNKIKRLINYFSVNYLIFNLEAYSNRLSNSDGFNKDDLIEKIKKVSQYARLVYADDFHLLVKIQEFFPTKKFTRTYSYYHLKKYRINYTLNERYEGKIKLFLNARLLKHIDCSGSRVSIDLRKENLKTDGNMVVLIFNRKVSLKDIDLIE